MRVQTVKMSSKCFADRLVKRVTEGITPQGYKAVDYEKLKQIAAEKKFQGLYSFNDKIVP